MVNKYTVVDERIKYFFQANQRVSAARNLGLQHSTGKYICFLDSDDEFDENHLQVFYDELRSNGFSDMFLYTRFRFTDAVSSNDYIPPKYIAYSDKRLERIMNVYLPYSPPVQTICVPSKVKQQVKFNTQLALSECYDFCARVAAFSEVKFLPITTVTLHGHTDNVSVPRNIEEEITFNLRQYEEFKKIKRDEFYKEIGKTKSFRKRMVYLQFELTKAYFKKKDIMSFKKSIFTALLYDPVFIFRKIFTRMKFNN